MNIEVANRLVELRKRNNLSQEALAEKLGVSRQAVSKWERAEASPDTDNLILLARLYQISLDDLLNINNVLPASGPGVGEEPAARNERESETQVEMESAAWKGRERAAQKGREPAAQVETESAAWKGREQTVQVETESAAWKGREQTAQVETESAAWKGREQTVQVETESAAWKGRELTTQGEMESAAWRETEPVVIIEEERPRLNYSLLRHFPVYIVVLMAFLISGAVWNAWHPGWMLLFLPPIWQTAIMALEKKDARRFAYPVLVVLLYLCLGFFGRLWHPGWIIFLTIPLYYPLVNYFRRLYKMQKKELDDILQEPKRRQ